MAYDFRKDFPLLQQNKIAYLDNAATAQRPQCVIDAESSFYRNSNANPCLLYTSPSPRDLG